MAKSGDNTEVVSAIDAAAERYGLDPTTLLTIAHVETGGTFDPLSKNPKSSAKGLFQFINSTGKQYGLSGEDAYDIEQAADAAARLTAANMRALRKALGREPTIGELYLAHQQGANGAVTILTSPSGSNAVGTLGYDEVALNVPRLKGETAAQFESRIASMTMKEFADVWITKAETVARTKLPPGYVPGVGMLSDTARPPVPVNASRQIDQQRIQFDTALQNTPLPRARPTPPAKQMLADKLNVQPLTPPSQRGNSPAAAFFGVTSPAAMGVTPVLAPRLQGSPATRGVGRIIDTRPKLDWGGDAEQGVAPFMQGVTAGGVGSLLNEPIYNPSYGVPPTQYANPGYNKPGQSIIERAPAATQQPSGLTTRKVQTVRIDPYTSQPIPETPRQTPGQSTIERIPAKGGTGSVRSNTVYVRPDGTSVPAVTYSGSPTGKPSAGYMPSTVAGGPRTPTGSAISQAQRNAIANTSPSSYGSGYMTAEERKKFNETYPGAAGAPKVGYVAPKPVASQPTYKLVSKTVGNPEYDAWVKKYGDGSPVTTNSAGQLITQKQLAAINGYNPPKPVVPPAPPKTIVIQEKVPVQVTVRGGNSAPPIPVPRPTTISQADRYNAQRKAGMSDWTTSSGGVTYSPTIQDKHTSYNQAGAKKTGKGSSKHTGAQK